MRKILCVVLAFLICSFSIISYVQAEEMTDLQTKQEELKNQIDDATGELEDVQEELSENLQQVQRLDERIANSQTELDELNTKIEELQNSIDGVEEKLKIAEERYLRQKEILEVRLVAMYETSDIQYLDVILSSRSVSEFLSNYFLITELANYDTELLEDMKQQKDEIELNKKKLDETRRTICKYQTKSNKNSKNIRKYKNSKRKLYC